jgi:hypothetical protein
MATGRVESAIRLDHGKFGLLEDHGSGKIRG